MQLTQIWSHQIAPGREKVIYGRGSPEMNFTAEVADSEKEKNLKVRFPLQYTRLVSLKSMGKIRILILPPL